MPFKNNSSVKLEDAWIYTQDGEPIMNVKDTVVFDDITTLSNEYQDEQSNGGFKGFCPNEYTYFIINSNRNWKNLVWAVYGWKASGPIRKRVLHRLWNKCEVKS